MVIWFIYAYIYIDLKYKKHFGILYVVTFQNFGGFIATAPYFQFNNFLYCSFQFLAIFWWWWWGVIGFGSFLIYFCYFVVFFCSEQSEQWEWIVYLCNTNLLKFKTHTINTFLYFFCICSKKNHNCEILRKMN